MSYFVGRNQELDSLTKMASQAQTGRGITVFITGEAGIGKTFLIEEAITRFLRFIPNLEVAKGYCHELTGEGDPFSPFFQVLDNLFERDTPSKWLQSLSNIPGWLLQLGSVHRLSNEASAFRYSNSAPQESSTFNPVVYQYTNLIKDLSKTCPLAIIIEDLHWADNSSLNLLYYLSQRITHLPVLLIGSFRPTDLKPKGGRISPLEEIKYELERSNSCKEIALDFLSMEEYIEYANQYLLKDSIQESMLLEIYRLTSGNPLFVSEMFRLLSDQDLIGKKLPDEYWRNFLPKTLEGVLRKRIGLLPQRIEKTMSFASIGGEAFTSIPLSRLESQNEIKVSERLDILEKKYKLIKLEDTKGIEGSTYRFIHVLVQTFCYEQLGPAQQVALHQKMGAILENLYKGNARVNYSRLAYHFEKGGVYQSAAKYYLLATARALDTYAYNEGLRNALQGVELLSQIHDIDTRPVKVQFLVPMIASHSMLGDYSAAIELASQCESYCKDLIKNRPAVRHSPRLDTLLNQVDSLTRDLLLIDERMADYPLSVDVPLEIEKEKLVKQEELKKLQDEVLKEQVLEKRQLYIGEILLAECYRWLGYCNMHKASVDYDTSIVFYEKALKIKEELEDNDNISLFLLELGDSYRRKGDTKNAVSILERSLKIQMNRGEFSYRALTLLTTAWIYLRNLKEFDKALAYCLEGLKFCEMYPDDRTKQQLMRACGSAYRQMGNYKLAEKHYFSALELAQEMEDKVQEAIAINSLGDFYTDVGDWEKALDSFLTSLKIRGSLGAVVGVENHNIGCAYQRVGNLDEAQKYFKQSLELYQQGNGVYGIYFNLRELAANFFIRGEFRQALLYVEECLGIAEREGYPAKGATLTKANILLFQDKLEEANDLYRQAINLKGGKEDEIISLSYVSRCEYLLGQWERALNSSERSLHLAKEHEHKFGLLLAKLYYGKALINLDLDSAILHSQEAFEGLKRLNSYHVIDAALTLSMLFVLSRDLSKAKEFLDYIQNKSAFEHQKHKILESRVIQSLYMREQGLLDEAAQVLMDAIIDSKELGYLLLARICNNYLDDFRSTNLRVYTL